MVPLCDSIVCLYQGFDLVLRYQSWNSIHWCCLYPSLHIESGKGRNNFFKWMKSNHWPCRWDTCIWNRSMYGWMCGPWGSVYCTKVTCGSEIPFLRKAAFDSLSITITSAYCVFPLPPQSCWTQFISSQAPRVEVVCWWICLCALGVSQLGNH